MSIRWKVLGVACAVIVALALVGHSAGENCGSCAPPSGTGKLECHRWSGGATTSFSYLVSYTIVDWLPSIRVVAVYGGPSVDSLSCEPKALLMKSDYGDVRRLPWDDLVGHLVRPLRVDRGRESRTLRGLNPYDGMWLIALACIAYSLAPVVVARKVRRNAESDDPTRGDF